MRLNKRPKEKRKCFCEFNRSVTIFAQFSSVFFVLFQWCGSVHSASSIHTTTHILFKQALVPFTSFRKLHSALSTSPCFFPKKTALHAKIAPAQPPAENIIISCGLTDCANFKEKFCHYFDNFHKK